MTAHVLLLDRQRAICEVIEAALAAAGDYRVSTATSVERARRILAADKPDLAIVDVPWPFQSGLKFAREALRLGVPTILLSGEPEAMRLLATFGCRFLAKPFHFAVLIEAIARVRGGDRNAICMQTDDSLRQIIERSGARNAI